MDTTNTDRQDVQVVPPQPATPRKRHVGRWLTLVVLAVLVGATSLFLLRDTTTRNVSAETGATVDITQTALVPQTIRVKQGESVTWTNKDDDAQTPHQLASNDDENGDPGHGVDSHGPMAQGESYTATFDEPGTYNYYDVTDPVNLKGTVIVEQ